MQDLLRNIHWLCAEFSVLIRAVSVRGDSNEKADLLSRWHLDLRSGEKFAEIMKNQHLVQVQVRPDDFKLQKL